MTTTAHFERLCHDQHGRLAYRIPIGLVDDELMAALIDRRPGSIVRVKSRADMFSVAAFDQEPREEMVGCVAGWVSDDDCGEESKVDKSRGAHG